MSSVADDDVSLEHVLVSYNRSEAARGSSRLDVGGAGHEPEPILPEWAIVAYWTCFCATQALINLAGCVQYARAQKKTGLRTLLAQIAVADLLSATLVAGAELWRLDGLPSDSSRWWWTHRCIALLSNCPLRLAVDSFATTAGAYLLLAAQLHALACANGDEAPSSRSSSSSSSDGDAGELLDASTRGKRPTDAVPRRWRAPRAAAPSALAWALAASLSAPPLLVALGDDAASCSSGTSAKLAHAMRALLAAFELVVPCAALSAASAAAIFRLYPGRTLRPSTSTSSEASAAMKVTLFLSCLFALTTAPRLVLTFGQAPWSRTSADHLPGSSSPPSLVPPWLPLALAMLHFGAPLLKPLAYVYFLSEENTHKGSLFSKCGSFCCHPSRGIAMEEEEDGHQ